MKQIAFGKIPKREPYAVLGAMFYRGLTTTAFRVRLHT
jgi:hypothetical protein